MRKTKSNIDEIVSTYRGMTDDQLALEADEISNMALALLTVSDSRSIEVEFDNRIVIEMKVTELSNQLAH